MTEETITLLCSIKGIGENTAMNLLIEMGGDVEMYENDKKLIAASGLDPSTGKHNSRYLRRILFGK